MLLQAAKRMLSCMGGDKYLREPKRHLGWLPLGHAFELNAGLLSNVMGTGGTYVFFDPDVSSLGQSADLPLPHLLMSALAYHQPIHSMAAVPAIMASIIDNMTPDQLDLLRALHSLTVGGATGSTALFHWAREKGLRYYDMVGMTEAAGPICARSARSTIDGMSIFNVGLMGVLVKDDERDEYGELVLIGKSAIILNKAGDALVAMVQPDPSASQAAITDVILRLNRALPFEKKIQRHNITFVESLPMTKQHLPSGNGDPAPSNLVSSPVIPSDFRQRMENLITDVLAVPLEELPQHEVVEMPPNIRLRMQMGYRALEDAGIAPRSLYGKPWGMFTSVNDSGWGERRFSEMDLEDFGRSLTVITDDNAAGRLAYFLNLTGPAVEIKTACSSSAVAIHRKALQNASCHPDDISYLEAHGTGTPVGDAIEVSALNKTFGGQRTRALIVGTAKAAIGHTEECAGLAGMCILKAILCFKHNIIPLQPHLGRINPELDLLPSRIVIPRKATAFASARNPRIIGISSFGLSGTLCHIQEPEQIQTPLGPSDSQPSIFAISSHSEASFALLFDQYCDYVLSPDAMNTPLADICRTSQLGRDHFTFGRTWAVTSWRDLHTLLVSALTDPAPIRAKRRPKVSLYFTLPYGQSVQRPYPINHPVAVGGEGVTEYVATAWAGVFDLTALFSLLSALEPGEGVSRIVSCPRQALDEHIMAYGPDEIRVVAQSGTNATCLAGSPDALPTLQSSLAPEASWTDCPLLNRSALQDWPLRPQASDPASC
ncbi:hypothetical protein EWM64_g6280, partial [Hericium alpestre]